jgi:HPt (histidine-containing phosphotransfer) domain-containing protein
MIHDVFYGSIQNPTDQPYEQIRRAAHRVKGAAGNLMCGQLYTASHQLEQAAATAHNAATPPTAEMIAGVQAGYTAMQQAATNYISYLQTIGV